jgi:DNA-binding NtrC family response regulator
MENERVSTKILIIEDDPAERISLQAALEAALTDVYIESVESGAAAESLVKVQFFDILIVDYRLPDTDGLSLIKRLKELSPDISPIVCTGYSSIELAVDSMRIGAYDYIVKPIKIDSLVKTITELLKDKELLLNGKKQLVAMVNEGFKYTYDTNDEVTVVLAPDTNVLLDKKSSFFGKVKGFFGAIKKYYWG